MKSLVLLFLMCTLIPSALCSAHNYGDGRILIAKYGYLDTECPRSQSISADITGNTLTITFNENVGIAHIVVKDSNGVYIDRENVFSTPDYATFLLMMPAITEWTSH